MKVPFIGKVNILFEDYARVEKDQNRKMPERINKSLLGRAIHGRHEAKEHITLLIDPKLERFNAYSIQFSHESLIRKGIEAKDILGTVVYDTIEKLEKKNLRTNALRIAQKNGTPLYNCSDDAKELTIIWPERADRLSNEGKK